MAKLSILMPIYNGAPYLENALERICNQTFKDLDIVISDNCSTDITSEIINKFAKTDERIRVFRQPKTISGGENFKFVLDQCRSPFFMLAAHDDYHDLRFVEKCFAIFEKKTISGVFTASKTVHYYTKQISLNSAPNLSCENSCYKNLLEYITNMYPSMIYGVFDVKLIHLFKEVSLNYYDWKDCKVMYDILLSEKFEIIHEPLFAAGIVDEVRQHRTTRKDASYNYEYLPFLKGGINSIFRKNSLSFFEKIHLTALHINTVLGFFVCNEANSCSYLMMSIARVCNKGLFCILKILFFIGKARG